MESAELWPSCACAVVFLLLLLWDVRKALRRRAHWVPGHSLLLSALTIQMLGLLAYSDISFVSSKRERNEQVDILVREDQLLFDCARLMMCVFLGYLLPAMIPPSNWSRVWSDIGALLLSVMVRMAFEVYFVWQVTKPLYRIPSGRQSVWFIVSNTTLFITSLLLLLLLSCAVLAGKSIRSILSGKSKWALSCCKSISPSGGPCKNSCCSDSGGPCKNWCCSQNPEKCKTIEDHVLKCWIVARVCQPEYIMARSVFSSLAGVVVTIAVVVLFVKWTCLHLPLDYGITHKTTIFFELAFILVGWMAVSFRWLTAVMYFPGKAEFLFFLEDFWTMSILELKADLDAQLTRPVYRMKKFSQRRPGQRVLLNLITVVRLHSVLLPMRVWLQMLMVLLSKACWGLSQMLMGMIRPFVMRMLHGSSWRQDRTPSSHSENLKFLRMPGETAYDLWIANKFGFKRAEANMERGIQMGEKNSAKLNQLIKHRLGQLKEDDKYCHEIRQMSLKRKAVSLMYCMIHFYEDNIGFDAINDAILANFIFIDIKENVIKAFDTAKVINKARKACSKAWDFLDFVDGSDVAADTDFHYLVNMWHKHYKNLKALKKAIVPLQMEGNATALKNWHGSKDWMRLTVHCNMDKKLYNKFKSFEENSQRDQWKHAIDNLQSRLAYLIHDCLVNQLGEVLIEQCNKWAQEAKEEEIYDAAFIAGKAKGLRDKIPDCERHHTNNENEGTTSHDPE